MGQKSVIRKCLDSSNADSHNSGRLKRLFFQFKTLQIPVGDSNALQKSIWKNRSVCLHWEETKCDESKAMKISCSFYCSLLAS